VADPALKPAEKSGRTRDATARAQDDESGLAAALALHLVAGRTGLMATTKGIAQRIPKNAEDQGQAADRFRGGG
jgi:hypothetical protein